MSIGVCHHLFINSYIFWKGNEVKVVRADKQPFMVATAFVDVRYYDQEFGHIKFTSKRRDEIPMIEYMNSKGSVEI